MARGSILGFVVGGMVSIVGLGAVSLLAPLPPSPDVADVPGAVSSPEQAPGDDRPAAGRDADLVEIAPTAPDTGASGDDLSSLQDADTQPAARPSVGGGGDGLDQPGAGGQSPEVATTTEDTPDTGAAGSAPASPDQSDTGLAPETSDPATRPDVGGVAGGLQNPADAGDAPDVSGVAERPSAPVNPAGLDAPDGQDQPISSVPEQPASPQVSDGGSGFGEAPKTEESPQVEAGADSAIPSTDQAAAVAGPESDAAPATSTTPGSRPEAGGAAPEQPGASADSAGAGSASPEQPVTAPTVSTDAPAQPSPSPDQPTAPDPAEAPAPRVAALPQAGAESDGTDGGPGIGTRVKPLTERDTRVAQLPSTVSDGASGGATEEPAIRRYGVAFENPDKKPLMSIVLIDDANALGAEALQEFPYPLTFAVDPSDPQAAVKLRAHRDAGFEVALLTDLPQAATPQDAEVALQAALSGLPETVALFEGVNSGFQGNRPLSDQVTAIAAGTGRGLVTQRNGLNTVQKLAMRQGVPSAVVFRDFDGAGQNPAAIRRFLDQAAFRADQEGAVVMLGRVRPDTISALLLWGLQDRASRVALAPLSASLLHVKEN